MAISEGKRLKILSNKTDKPSKKCYTNLQSLPYTPTLFTLFYLPIFLHCNSDYT